MARDQVPGDPPKEGREGTVTDAAFYCVADARYFLGAVGMINSLRLAGQAEPVFVLDCGLEPAQRRMLEPHATLVPAPGDAPPYLAKTVAPLAHPAEVMVLIDADMVVTRPLTELIERAAPGAVVAFANDTDRFVPDWGELLDLGTARRGTYVSSGLVMFGGSFGAELLRLLDDRQRRVDFGLTFYGEDRPDYPFRYPEQDVLNAILATRPRNGRVVALDHRLMATPPFRALRPLGADSLRCAYADGVEPYLLHQYARKPWLEPMDAGIYGRLLARLLLRPDVPVSVPRGDLPLRMREGFLAELARRRIEAQAWIGWRLRERLPARIVDRIDEIRHRRAVGSR
jgi:hypothetical protein